jgi:hypothetical protein
MKKRKVRGLGDKEVHLGSCEEGDDDDVGIENDDEREKKIQLRNDDSEIGEIDDDGDDGDGNYGYDDGWI